MIREFHTADWVTLANAVCGVGALFSMNDEEGHSRSCNNRNSRGRAANDLRIMTGLLRKERKTLAKPLRAGVQLRSASGCLLCAGRAMATVPAIMPAATIAAAIAVIPSSHATKRRVTRGFLNCVMSGAASLAAMMLVCTGAYAIEPHQETGAAAGAVQTVMVSRTRDPADKSYRKMVSGMDLFEMKHGLAPNASLRFKLLPRQRDTSMDGIVLEIIGDTVAIPVPVAPDHTFVLERHQKALDEDASVTPNRRAHSMTWRTDIRTPGLPRDVRRLGDLRLECQVGMEAGLVSNVLPVFGQLAIFVQRMLDYCNGKEVRYLFFAEHPLFSVAMVSGRRREVLSVDELYAGASRDLPSRSDLAHCDCEVLLDRTYFLPLGDRSWPDDTLIEFEYMDDKFDRHAAVPPAVTVTNREPK